jgi:tetratricopeptide (TPR) repeat protein
MAVGVAVRFLGISNPDLFQDAVMAFDDASAAGSGYHLADVLIGELFLEKYRATDAREAIAPVLEANPRNPRALLAQAKILGFEGVGGSVSLVREALEVNPAYADAWAFLAGHFLTTGEIDEAQEAVEKALEMNPTHLEALSVLAAIQFLTDDQAAFEDTRHRVLGLNPVCPEFFTVLAHHAETKRRYRTAVDFAAEAVAMDLQSWRGHGILGMNQLRTGMVEEGRRSLEVAFQGDPYNPWYLNTLDLLDTFTSYRTINTEHFEILIQDDEAELLGPYAAAVAEEAFAALRARYGSVPPTPVRLEIYPRHADFSVRTLGIPGLGALGVSFGSTLVMDSPSALDVGSFNWLSTLWHELAHAFHLAISDHRVPRWFSEGLAVHEQRKAQARWGYKVSPAWLRAYGDGRLHPVSRLDLGFMRPEYPQQVVFSYFQASLVFELIERRYGLPAIVDMMEAYGEGLSDEEVFRQVLGESPSSFDEIFDAYVQDRWGNRIAAVQVSEGAHPATGTVVPLSDLQGLAIQAEGEPDNFHARLNYGKGLLEAGRMDEAEAELEAAFQLFPEYGGMDGPLLALAEIHRQRGDLERAGGVLHQLGGLNETAYGAFREEAEVWQEAGRPTAAAVALERAVEVHPFDLEAQMELASAYDGLGDWGSAVKARRAILALDPTDRADAHFQLGQALARAGERDEARTQVLRALEIAPSFEPALDLLLELRRGDPVEGKDVREMPEVTAREIGEDRR